VSTILRLMLIGLGLAGILHGVLGCTATTTGAQLPNIEAVTPQVLRLGQPTRIEQWGALRNLGVRRVVKLDCDDEGGGRNDLDAQYVGIRVYRLCIQPRTDGGILSQFAAIFRGPTLEQLVAMDWFARAMATGDPSIGRWAIHCVHGCDRTGLLSAMVGRYRYGWTRGQARGYLEHAAGGCYHGLPGTDRAWKKWNEEVFGK
jgi:hypothetical protein